MKLNDGWYREPPTGYSSLSEPLVNAELLSKMRSAHAAGEWPIYLCGDVGRGKSYAAALVYVRWSTTANFVSYSDLIGTAIRGAKEADVCRYTATGQFVEMTEAAWWLWLKSLGLLVVDEIGLGISDGRAKEWREEMMWKVMEVRAGKPLLMTGNLSPDGIAKHLGDRIQSRIAKGTVIELVGADKRLNGVRGRMYKVKVN